jgi:hypothetical protein
MMQTHHVLAGLSAIAGKSIHATFDAGLMSSDGGLIIFREVALGSPRS